MLISLSATCHGLFSCLVRLSSKGASFRVAASFTTRNQRITQSLNQKLSRKHTSTASTNPSSCTTERIAKKMKNSAEQMVPLPQATRTRSCSALGNDVRVVHLGNSCTRDRPAAKAYDTLTVSRTATAGSSSKGRLFITDVFTYSFNRRRRSVLRTFCMTEN